MMKAAVASLTAIMGVSPGLYSSAYSYAQAPAAGQIVMEGPEQAEYDNAMNKITAPAQQGPALEAYLAKYPKSPVKNYVLQRIMIDYSSVDPAKAITAADNVLQVDPNNLQATVIEVAFRKDAAEKATDASTKQSGLDTAATFAQKGLTIASGAAPTGTTAADYTKLTDYAKPLFNEVMGEAALNKKDGAATIAAYKAALAAMKPEQLSTPPALQDTFYVAQGYMVSTPPDYSNCAFYATRAAALAPDNFKTQLQPTADYCYKKFHGSKDGYDAVVTAAKANVDPPADFKIAPAPTDADQVNKIMSDTPEAELPKLALSDKEYILQYGTSAQADKVFDTIKGKSVEIPGATVIAATADQLQVAVSDDAVQSKTADFTFAMKAPLKTVPATGSKVTLSGTYTSYTQKPVMITMSDAEEAGKKAPVKAPVKKGPPARRR